MMLDCGRFRLLVAWAHLLVRLNQRSSALLASDFFSSAPIFDMQIQQAAACQDHVDQTLQDVQMIAPRSQTPTACRLEPVRILDDMKNKAHPSAHARRGLRQGLRGRAGGALSHFGHDTAVADHSLVGHGRARKALPLDLSLIDAMRLLPASVNPETLVSDTTMLSQLTLMGRTVRALNGAQQFGCEARTQQAQLHLTLVGHAEATRRVGSDLDSPRELAYPKALRKYRICLDRRAPRSRRVRASTPHDLRNPHARTSHLETWMKQHKPVFTPQPDNDAPRARPPRVVANP